MVHFGPKNTLILRAARNFLLLYRQRSGFAPQYFVLGHQTTSEAVYFFLCTGHVWPFGKKSQAAVSLIADGCFPLPTNKLLSMEKRSQEKRKNQEQPEAPRLSGKPGENISSKRSGFVSRLS